MHHGRPESPPGAIDITHELSTVLRSLSVTSSTLAELFAIRNHAYSPSAYAPTVWTTSPPRTPPAHDAECEEGEEEEECEDRTPSGGQGELAADHELPQRYDSGMLERESNRMKRLMMIDEPRRLQLSYELLRRGVIARILDACAQIAYDVPNAFFCPLSIAAMIDPVCCDDGHSYERCELNHHVSVNGCFSPITRQSIRLVGKNAVCNRCVAQLMESWVFSTFSLYKSGQQTNETLIGLAQTLEDKAFTRRDSQTQTTITMRKPTPLPRAPPS